MVFRLIIFGLLGLSAIISRAQSDLEKGINYFDKRAENHEGLKVDSININQAIFYFKKAAKSEKDKELATDYLLLCYYYKAAFVVKTKDEQKKFYSLGTILGEEAIKEFPTNKGILLWYIANFSKYGEANGIIASAKNGLADKIKRLTQRLLDFDPSFADGAPHRIMGVINYKVPHIPLFLTWPSKEKAEEHLKRALSYNPKSISNIYYYAEYLYEVKRFEEAKILLKKIIASKPREDAIIEDLYDISMAKKLLTKID